jgi:NTP pyrophosphatase (non-canonical NTP hydrolase)
MNKTEHLFQCLAEESGEVIQAAMKCTRFAVEGHYPDGTPNMVKLIMELNDLTAVVELMVEHGIPILVGLGDREQINTKKIKVIQMMEVAKERGALQ